MCYLFDGARKMVLMGLILEINNGLTATLIKRLHCCQDQTGARTIMLLLETP